MNFIKELQEAKTNDIDKCVELIVNTIKAKNLYRKGGWGAVNKKLNDRDYCNPNFGITNIAIANKLPNIKISIKTNMSFIEKEVNKKLGVNAIEYRVDRLCHYFVILL